MPTTVANPADATARRIQVAILGALLAAFALMLGAASGDLWMDEIWSVLLAGFLHRDVDLLVLLRHDNNHLLNTLYLYFLDHPKTQLQYRLHSVVAGMACLSLLAHTAWKQWGPREALLTVVLAGVSFPILLYATEARGYSLVMLLAVVSYLAWRSHLRSGGTANLLLFWAASILGLLAQATFVVAMIAFGLGQLAMDEAGSPLRRRVLRLARVHLLPMLFTAGWYWFVLGRQVVGGGDASGGWSIVGQTAALLLGLPDSPVFHVAAMAGVVAIVLLGVRGLRNSGDAQWLFYLAVLLIAPALLLAWSYPRIFHVRYFAAAFPFLMLLLARLWVTGWTRSIRGGRALLLLALAVFLAGNLQRDYFLLAFGRGQYSRALDYMLRHSPPGPVWVGSDNDNRNVMVLQFHAARIPGGGRLRYVDEAHAPEYKPAWFILNSLDLAEKPPEQVQVDRVGEYRLERRYAHAGVSGWTWFVYRRVR